MHFIPSSFDYGAEGYSDMDVDIELFIRIRRSPSSSNPACYAFILPSFKIFHFLFPSRYYQDPPCYSSRRRRFIVIIMGII